MGTMRIISGRVLHNVRYYVIGWTPGNPLLIDVHAVYVCSVTMMFYNNHCIIVQNHLQKHELKIRYKAVEIFVKSHAKK